MFDKIYYIDKKKKVEEKIQREKDEFLMELANNVVGLAGRVQKFSQSQGEREEEYQEVVKILKENEEKNDKEAKK